MAIVTYSNPPLGFGVTYDEGELTHAEGPGDARFAAAWTDRFTTRVVGGVVFCPAAATAEEISDGAAPSLLITTDRSPLAPGVLARWDWDEVTRREAAPFMTLTGADAIETSAVYWRGFPVLQLAVVAPPDGAPSMPVQLLGTLYTPAQTFSSLLVVPRGLEDPVGPDLPGGHGRVLPHADRAGGSRAHRLTSTCAPCASPPRTWRTWPRAELARRRWAAGPQSREPVSGRR